MSSQPRYVSQTRDEYSSPPIPMRKLAIVISILIGVTSLFGAYFLLPYRVDNVEKTLAVHTTQQELRFEAIETDQRIQREILIRIDENVKELRRKP